MERSKYWIIIWLIFASFWSINLFADNRAEIYQAYISNRMDRWKSIIDKLNAQTNQKESDRLELLNYQYGYIAWCMGNKRTDEAEKYIEQADKNIGILEKSGYNLSMVYAYKSAIYGYKIGLSVWKAPVFGPKSKKYMQLAIKINPNNPYGYIQEGNSLYFMPAAFGGSKKEALHYYLKARELMEIPKKNSVTDWNYLSLLVSIGMTYTELGDLNSAKTTYETILRIEPHFDWVKNKLYPGLLQKIKS